MSVSDGINIASVILNLISIPTFIYMYWHDRKISNKLIELMKDHHILMQEHHNTLNKVYVIEHYNDEQ